MPVNYDVTEDLVTGTTATDDVVSNKNERKNKVKDEESKSDENNIFGIFVTDLEGNKPDSKGKDFFRILNQKCNNIFNCDLKSGEIKLKKDKNYYDVNSSSNTSQTLAKIIEENIGTNAKQRINLRVSKNVPKINFDGFENGYIDLDDILFKKTKKYQNALQACIIYHFLYERTNCENYEVSKMEVAGTLEFDNLHNDACINEARVWNEMLSDNINRRTDLGPFNFHPFNNEQYKNTIFSILKYGIVNVIIFRKQNNYNEVLNFEIHIDN